MWSVFAFVVLADHAEPPTQATAQALQRHCLELLIYFKVPGWLAFVDQLPQTASQKLARGEVKRLAARLHQQQQASDLRADKKRPASHAG